MDIRLNVLIKIYTLFYWSNWGLKILLYFTSKKIYLIGIWWKEMVSINWLDFWNTNPSHNSNWLKPFIYTFIHSLFKWYGLQSMQWDQAHQCRVYNSVKRDMSLTRWGTHGQSIPLYFIMFLHLSPGGVRPSPFFQVPLKSM